MTGDLKGAGNALTTTIAREEAPFCKLFAGIKEIVVARVGVDAEFTCVIRKGVLKDIVLGVTGEDIKSLQHLLAQLGDKLLGIDVKQGGGDVFQLTTHLRHPKLFFDKFITAACRIVQYVDVELEGKSITTPRPRINIVFPKNSNQQQRRYLLSLPTYAPKRR